MPGRTVSPSRVPTLLHLDPDAEHCLHDYKGITVEPPDSGLRAVNRITVDALPFHCSAQFWIELIVALYLQ